MKNKSYSFTTEIGSENKQAISEAMHRHLCQLRWTRNP